MYLKYATNHIQQRYVQAKNNNILRILSLLFIVISLLITSCNVKNNCTDFFNGKWKYEHFDVEYLYVERNKEKQFEYMENGKYYYEFDINWITDCNYELIYIGTTSPNPAVVKIGEKMLVEIIKVNDSITEYKTVFRNIEEIGKMVRIK